MAAARGTSMQLAYSFLGICLVLLAAFLDAWCHGSLQRDRNSNGSEGGPGHCFGALAEKLGSWGEMKKSGPALLLLASPLPSFLSLLLCLGPSGGDRGPQAQKPPKLETGKAPAKVDMSANSGISDAQQFGLVEVGDLSATCGDEACKIWGFEEHEMERWAVHKSLVFACSPMWGPCQPKEWQRIWGIVHRWVSWTPRSCRQWTSPFLISTSCWNHGYVRTELGKAIRLRMEMARPPASLGYSPLFQHFLNIF